MCVFTTHLLTRGNLALARTPCAQSPEFALRKRRVSLSKPWDFKFFRMRTYKNHAKMYGSSTMLTPLESSKVSFFRRKHASVTPLESALTKRVRRNFFRMIQLHQSGGRGVYAPMLAINPFRISARFPVRDARVACNSFRMRTYINQEQIWRFPGPRSDRMNH